MLDAYFMNAKKSSSVPGATCATLWTLAKLLLPLASMPTGSLAGHCCGHVPYVFHCVRLYGLNVWKELVSSG